MQKPLARAFPRGTHGIPTAATSSPAVPGFHQPARQPAQQAGTTEET